MNEACDRCAEPIKAHKFDFVSYSIFYENPAGPVLEGRICEDCFKELRQWLVRRVRDDK